MRGLTLTVTAAAAWLVLRWDSWMSNFWTVCHFGGPIFGPFKGLKFRPLANYLRFFGKPKVGTELPPIFIGGVI
jgi:hypothetical protein